MFISQKEIQCAGLRYPKIFSFKNTNYLIGSKKYDQKGEIVKYGVFLMKMDEEFNVLDEGRFIEFDEYPYLKDITLTSWTRDINVKDDTLYLNVEIKQNVNNETFYDNNILLSTTNLLDFTFIKRYEVTDFLFKDLTYKNDHYLFSSKIMKDEEDPDYFWGIYLFNIFINGKEHRPKFDAIVDYKKDKGHLIHNVVTNFSQNKHVMYFSIRHKVEKSFHKSGFIYKIYKAETNDFINYFNTQEIEFKNKHTGSEWYSYSHYFSYKGQQYIVTNQDDYGKYSNPVLFKKKETLETFVSELYDVSERQLKFSSDLKYIFYEEMASKKGNRYENIKKSNENEENYSTYAPSCKRLYNVLTELNISADDSIIDIGSGWGFCLSLFNKFPFKKITGIEISSSEVEVCKQNLKVLNIENIELLNQDILNFNKFNEYNYFYLYNPFSAEIFDHVLSKVKEGSIIIYKNVHEKEKLILSSHNFHLQNVIKGEDRDYFIFKKLE